MMRGIVRGEPADPLFHLQRMQDEVGRIVGMFGKAASQRGLTLPEIMQAFALSGMAGEQRTPYEFPPVNIWINEDELVVVAEVAGLGPEDLEVTVYRDTLSLKGKRASATEDEDEVTWHRQERMVGSFARTITLPYVVDATKVEAQFKDGRVRITAPRPESDKPKKIKIIAE
jgi:HSP20 family protein